MSMQRDEPSGEKVREMMPDKGRSPLSLWEVRYRTPTSLALDSWWLFQGMVENIR